MRDLDVEEGGPLDAPTNKLDKSLGSWIYSYLYTGVETNQSWMNEDRKQMHILHMCTHAHMFSYVYLRDWPMFGANAGKPEH